MYIGQSRYLSPLRSASTDFEAIVYLGYGVIRCASFLDCTHSNLPFCIRLLCSQYWVVRVAREAAASKPPRIASDITQNGSTSENDIRIVVFVNAEETLKGRLITETTGKFQPEG
jgi:hypothetical protein